MITIRAKALLGIVWIVGLFLVATATGNPLGGLMHHIFFLVTYLQTHNA